MIYIKNKKYGYSLEYTPDVWVYRPHFLKCLGERKRSRTVPTCKNAPINSYGGSKVPMSSLAGKRLG